MKSIKSDHLKIMIMKMGLIISVLIIAIMTFLALFFKEDNVIYIFLCVLFATPGFSLFLFVPMNFKKQNIYQVPFKTFSEFDALVKPKLLAKKYIQICDERDLKVYRFQKSKSVREIFISCEIKDLDEDKFTVIYERARAFFEKDLNYIKNKLYSRLQVTFVIHTNKITPFFNRFVNSFDIDKRFFKFPVGISYGGNKMYINNAIDGFDMPFQTKMYKEFMKLVDIEYKR